MTTRSWSTGPLTPSGQRSDVLALISDLLIHAARRLSIGRARAKPDAASDAMRVREMARRLQASDPGFASDLLAAADRHEAIAQGRR